MANVVGQADGQAFLWSQSLAYKDWDSFRLKSADRSSASGVSNDGQVVVGSSVASMDGSPFRWTGERHVVASGARN